MPAPHKRLTPFSKALQDRMTALGLRQRDLGPILGRQFRVSKILCGKIQPSPEDLGRLHYAFAIPYPLMIPRPPKTWRRKIIKHLKRFHAWP